MTSYSYSYDLEEIQRTAQIGAQCLINAAYDQGDIDKKLKEKLEEYVVLAYRPTGFMEKLKERLTQSGALKDNHITFKAFNDIV
jgi:hypothetical protein